MTTSRAVFSGIDGSDRQNLWVTDGTAAGTTELTVTSPGLFDTNVVPDFTVFGGKVLFEGKDASGHLNLWVTDGTTAGTSEVTAAGANPNRLFNVVPPDFTVLGSEALFEGYDASNHYNLWVTDGTAAGTSELAVAGAFSGGLGPSDITVLGN
jgi:ELWxxDGT repeat protein